MDNKSRAIRVPTNVLQRERKIQRAERELAVKLGRDATDEEVAEHAELKVEDVVAMRDISRTVTSLDRPVGEEDGTSLGELMASEAPQPEDEIIVTLERDAVQRALQQLPDNERQVVALRYGVDTDGPVGQRETARRMGIRPAEARKLEQRALERLASVRELEALHSAA